MLGRFYDFCSCTAMYVQRKKKGRTGPCRFESHESCRRRRRRAGRAEIFLKFLKPRKTNYAAGADEDIVETGSDVNAGILWHSLQEHLKQKKAQSVTDVKIRTSAFFRDQKLNLDSILKFLEHMKQIKEGGKRNPTRDYVIEIGRAHV